MKNLFILVLIASMLAACAGKQVKDKPEIASPSVEQSQPVEKPAPAVTTAMEKKAEINPLKDPNNILSKRSVYFDFDKYEVKPEYRALVEAHAKYLAEHPKASIAIQGNADERGSREYNLALGQERAVAIKQVMNVLGISDKQIETVSFGMEKPKALGHDEASWAENRRADIVYSDEQ
jgi:peptidoglycan-associated lipoprotein